MGKGSWKGHGCLNLDWRLGLARAKSLISRLKNMPSALKDRGYDRDGVQHSKRRPYKSHINPILWSS